jgi:hypothetical protein
MRLIKGKLFALIAAVAAAIISVSFMDVNNIRAGSGLSDIADFWTTPVPIETAQRGEGETKVRVFRDDSPHYLRANPDLFGKVVYQKTQQYMTSSIGSGFGLADGKVIRGETWLAIGNDGAPLRFYGRYTLPDGSIYEERYQTALQNIVVLFGEGRCHNWPGSSLGMRDLIPPFVDVRQLEREGFVFLGQAPLTLDLSGSDRNRDLSLPQIEAAYSSGSQGQVERWQIRLDGFSPEGGRLTRTNLLEIGEDAVLLYSSSTLVDGEGRVLSEEYFARGPVEAYNASSVPEAVWSFSQQAEELCK